MAIDEESRLLLNFHLIYEIGGVPEAGSGNVAILLVMQDHPFPHDL
jgi:hypothetical protein